ncbi:hypothetical protein Taro_016900 [Colocasia esculenta]|uniref:Uncharacterized protein n=1 Tax=Colocasia esculenta TaxID=4460 RepID=A0A843UM28_COLES|nr:hypothetical protein [Colocasia esculenta]
MPPRSRQPTSRNWGPAEKGRPPEASSDRLRIDGKSVLHRMMGSELGCGIDCEVGGESEARMVCDPLKGRPVDLGGSVGHRVCCFAHTGRGSQGDLEHVRSKGHHWEKIVRDIRRLGARGTRWGSNVGTFGRRVPQRRCRGRRRIRRSGRRG